MPKDPKIIDLDDALNRALGDVAFLRMMFEEFQQVIPEMLAALQASVASGDMPQLARDAHQFKGTAINLGAVAIASAAFTLEKIAKSGNPAGALEAFERIQSAVISFHQYLALIDWTDFD